MRTCNRFLAVAGVVTAICALAGTSHASISGSKHDFGSFGWAQNQICLPCHTPHNARTIGPLWNRTDTGATYTVYASESLDAVVGQPVPGSRNVATQSSGSDLCLSCHDGTIAVTSVVKNAFHNDGTRPGIAPVGPALGTDGKLLSSRTANLGTDLTNDHPVAFDYAAARTAENTKLGRTDALSQLARTKLRGTQSFVDGAINPTNGTGVDLPLFNGKMECDTCHNVHDPGADGGAMTMYPFLRADMNASKLCFTCHIK
jgi:hypothetical protein